VPGQVPPAKYNFAATAAGMKQLANPLGLDDDTRIDIVVVGSSAVNPVNGARVGKGEGFAELEYGMLRQLGQIDENTAIITTVHDCQVVKENMPPEGNIMMKHDLSVDIIVTPTQVIRVPKETSLPKPTGIYWDLLSRQKLGAIKVLQKLKAKIEQETGVELKLAEQDEALPPLAKRGRKRAPAKKAPEKASEGAPQAGEAPQAPAASGVKSRLSRRPRDDDGEPA